MLWDNDELILSIYYGKMVISCVSLLKIFKYCMLFIKKIAISLDFYVISNTEKWIQKIKTMFNIISGSIFLLKIKRIIC